MGVAVLLGSALGWCAPSLSSTVTVTFDYPASVYVSPSGQGRFKYVGYGSPLTIPLDVGEYDVLAEGPADLFHVWHGERLLRTPATVAEHIAMHKEMAWSRVIMAAMGGGAILVALLALMLRSAHSQRRTLEGQLDEEKAYGELRPGALPKSIGRYRILRRLGSGGMATVYQVEDEYGDVYALKVPDTRILDAAQTAERFFREMKIGSALRHAGIVRILEVNRGDDRTHPYIAQEYIDGESLRQLLDREGRLEESRSVQLTIELAEALYYAHTHNVIHRDIKPANLMLTRDGRLRIMDFGIAKATEFDTLTGTDTTLGTPDYMAPEQIDSRAASVQSDLYSAGVVLFEMLSGRLPFEETDAYRLLMRKMREKAPRVSAIRPQVSKRLDNLVALMLSADPTKRPTSAQELARMLRLIAHLSPCS